jgi:hypothetical protein
MKTRLAACEVILAFLVLADASASAQAVSPLGNGVRSTQYIMTSRAQRCSVGNGP